MVAMAGKVPYSCGTESMFNVKNVTLESISDTVSSLSHTSHVATISFLQAVNEIVEFI